MNTTPAPMVWPALQARDCPALIEFLVEAFGFIKTAVYPDGETIAHAQLDFPDGGGIMLGSYRPDGRFSREPGTAGAYVVCEHVDQVYARAKACGAKIISEPTEQDYGNYEFIAQDPEGNLWSFGAYRGEPRPE